MKKLAIGIMALMLSGCVGEEFGDLKEWMNGVGQNLRGKVEPLPEVKPYEPFLYAAYDLADPFSTGRLEIAKSAPNLSSRPNQNRPKETLEAYDLEQLRMVGTLQRGKEMNALIKTPDGNLYRVKKGSYLGQNFGMVTAIDETGLQLKEIVEDSGGDWVERTASLMLEQQE